MLGDSGEGPRKGDLALNCNISGGRGILSLVNWVILIYNEKRTDPG